MPLRVQVTEGTVADCKAAPNLIKGMKGEHLLADKGYDSDEFIKLVRKQGMKPVIPPRKSRKIQREYDKDIYKERHKVENFFLKIKQWRGIATRYAKNLSSFQAFITIACIMLWDKFI